MSEEKKIEKLIQLESEFVFIDTQVFHHEKFRFSSTLLKRLQELCKENEIKLVVTDVLVSEVEKKIAEQIHESIIGFNAFRKGALFAEEFIDADRPGLLSKLDQKRLTDFGKSAWHKYLHSCSAIELSADTVSAKKILDMYFSGNAPFGKGKKKSEFPDAISMLELMAWHKQFARKIYIISGDSDLEEWCRDNTFATYIKGLPEYIDLVLRSKASTKLIADAIESIKPNLINLIEDEFMHCEFEIEDSWDGSAEITSIQSCDYDNVNILKIDNQSVTISVAAVIAFDAMISGYDYENSIYDKEDNLYLLLPEFEREVRRTGIYETIIEIEFSGEDLHELTAQSIEIGGDQIITLSQYDE